MGRLAFPILLAASLLAGCNGGGGEASAAPEGKGPATAAEGKQQTQDRLAEIQNNPNMPPAEKERALAAFKSNSANAPR